MTINLHVQTIEGEEKMCPEYRMGQSGRRVWRNRLWSDHVKSSVGQVKEVVFYSKGNGKHLVSLKLG